VFSITDLTRERPRGFVLFSVLLLALGGCSGGNEARTSVGEEEPTADPEVWEGDVEAATRVLRPQEGTDQDWEIFRSTVMRAWEMGLDTLPMGESMIRIALPFVGTQYVPATLEVAGEEGVVVNFQGFDCVTLVENVFALARFIRAQDPAILQADSRARDVYRGFLREIRYREARVDGYPSRLHYFSDWIRDNEAMGLVREMTEEMGGSEEYKAIDFMTNHPEAYRQMADYANRVAIQETEVELSSLPRFKIPEWEIQDRASQIQNGDIIATTSTVEGLDVAHTGLAIWQGSELHLLHAPLVGEVVEISRRPLAERILRFQGQDGIRVIRPLAPPGVIQGQPGP